MKADESVKAGNLELALSQLQEAIRGDPAKPEYRTFLFQLYCVLGDWNRALTQLNVVAEMSSDALLMAQTYRELLLCEAFREEVFQGKREPLVFNMPNPWMGALVQSLNLSHAGKGDEAQALFLEAMDLTAACSGFIDGEAFDWLADADMRLGPVLEVVINGKYYWVPMESILVITFSEPEDLRDLVWLPVSIQWKNQGNSIGFVPTRYPGPATLSDTLNALARKTEWQNLGSEFYTGAGQRMFATNIGEYSLLDTRKIEFTQVNADSDDAVEERVL